MTPIFSVKVMAWDSKGKILEITNHMGVHGWERAKTLMNRWYKNEHVGCDKWIKVLEDGKRLPVAEYRKFKSLGDTKMEELIKRK